MERPGRNKTDGAERRSGKQKTCGFVLTEDLAAFENAGEVKGRDEAFACRLPFLEESIFYAEADRKIDQRIIFLRPDVPAQFFRKPFFTYGGILAHQAQPDFVAIGFIQIADDRP